MWHDAKGDVVVPQRPPRATTPAISFIVVPQPRSGRPTPRVMSSSRSGRQATTRRYRLSLSLSRDPGDVRHDAESDVVVPERPPGDDGGTRRQRQNGPRGSPRAGVARARRTGEWSHRVDGPFRPIRSGGTVSPVKPLKGLTLSGPRQTVCQDRALARRRSPNESRATSTRPPSFSALRCTPSESSSSRTSSAPARAATSRGSCASFPPSMQRPC